MKPQSHYPPEELQMEPGYDLDTLPPLLEPSDAVEGQLEKRPDDFQVEEIPLYEINEEGPHLYFEVEKTNLTTNRAVDVLEDQLNVGENFEIGYAGRKDKNARTVQRMSLEHIDPEDLEAVNHERMAINVLGYHRNKLQPGHLAGNRFTVKLRQTGETDPGTVAGRQEELEETGVPNYFGPQRFGLRQDTSKLGEAMVQGNLGEFVKQYFGRPSNEEPPACREARERFEADQLEDAIDAWPDQYQDKRRGLSAWIDSKDPRSVLSAISRNRRQLFVSAYQSQLFNELLGDRMPAIDRVRKGDVAKKTDTGGMFEVEDPDAEQPRARRFEISPTGLLPGRDPWYATGQPGRQEDALLDRHNLTEDDFERVSYLRTDGGRRPFRFRTETEPPETGNDEHGDYLRLAFTIPSGCYATVFLREILGTTP